VHMAIRRGIAAVLAFCACLPAEADNIFNSKHNFASAQWSGGRICVACHTPHKSQMDSASIAAPLWNHTVSSMTYPVYTTSSGYVLGQPSGISKLCLSCHDGSVAVDAFGGNAGGQQVIDGVNLRVNQLLRTTPNAHHVISAQYDTALANATGLNDPSTTNVTIGTGANQAGPGSISNLMLYGPNKNMLECSTCHDVHNRYTVTAPLLKMSRTGFTNSLCVVCHF